MFVEISVFLFWVIIIIVIILVVLLYLRKISINSLDDLASQTIYFNSNGDIIGGGWMGFNNVTTNIIQAQYIINNKAKISNLIVLTENAPGSGQYYQFFVQKNGVKTKLEVLVSENNTKNTNDTVIVEFEKGDLISIETDVISNNNTIATASIKLTNVVAT